MGLIFFFPEQFWDLVVADIMALLWEMDLGVGDLQRLNHALVSLIPKVKGASKVGEFGPITLLNCVFNFFPQNFWLIG